ncbi:LysM domain-containing protein [Citricoccus sp. SGAir0253]|uniref:DUF6448 family protein n=1 Tax=Citricoccus sp. SGAir0253 TaxID=2567881 RepID=UPI0010CD1569|nr:DUF6448 family protein [Citricoccus sp. SGAir0253]QCU76944.1 LysM domain-containing protein [Citricoccus sp. SGAir0253]
MTPVLVTLVFAATLALVLLRPLRASAHCDTMDGPTARDGMQALETGNLALALRWVGPEGETELREVFASARAARGLGEAARQVADRWFVENLVRVHRAGEGAPYTGLQPSGTPVDEWVTAADAALASGDLSPLEELVPAERWDELERRFAAVRERQDHDPTDLDAGRAYVEAYVGFVHYAGGEEHDHGGDHAHGHAGGHHH